MPATGAGSGFSAELLEQLKEHLPEALFASLRGTVATYEKQLDSTRGELDTTRGQLQYAQQKIQVLEEHLRRRRIAKYGPGSETLGDLQLQLLEEEPGVSSQEVAAESAREALPPTQKEQKQQRRPHPGRQMLPAHLPRVEKIIACTPEQCVCGKCGGETSVIGYETSEVLKVKPVEYYVEVSKREKRACKQKRCEEQGVKAAPLPTRIIDKSLVCDEIIIDTIVSKYADYVPLYRQSVILERETGIEMARATLDGWVMRVGELLRPIAAAMSQELLKGDYIQADETPVDVQMHDGRGRNHQAYLWQYGSPGGTMVFDFRLGRGRDGPQQFLGSFHGILQTDGYAAYDRVGDDGVVHAACWAHVRRKFYEICQAMASPIAQQALHRIAALYAIEQRIRGRSDYPARPSSTRCGPPGRGLSRRPCATNALTKGGAMLCKR